MFSGKLRLADDNDDFSGDFDSSRSNLSNIFGVSLNKNQSQQQQQQQQQLNFTNSDKEHSLKYVSPKQQMKPVTASAILDHSDTDRDQAWSTQIAKVVSAFRLINQENVSQGKVGLAILKSKDDQYKLILYRTKTKVLATMAMNEATKIFIKRPYFQFRDDLQMFWSVLFENGEENTVIDIIKGKVAIDERQDDEVIDSSKMENIQDTKENELTSSNHNVNNTSNIQEIENYSSDEKLKDTKAQILSRMAKMGQPLPKLTQTTTDFSDSSDAEVNKVKSPPTKPVAIPRKMKVQQQQMIAIAPSTSTNQLTQVPIVTHLSGFNPNVNIETQCLSMLLTENRTLNSELRMNMSKIETKIEKVLDKIDTIDSDRSKGSSRKCKEDEILELEEKLLQFKKENRTLKLELEKIQYQRLEDSNSKGIKADEIAEFKKSIDLFDIEVDSFSSANDLLKELLRKYDIQCSFLRESLENHKKTIEENNAFVNSLKLQHEQEVTSLLKNNEEFKIKLSDVEKNLEGLKQENIDLTEQKEKCEEASEIDSVLKDIMNNLYLNLVIKFEENKNFVSSEILRICGSAIKQETNNAIKRKDCK